MGSGSSTRRSLAAIVADGVLFLHTLFVVFALFGALLYPVDTRFLLLHLPVVLWSSVVNLANWTCPLTPLEQSLRQRAGQQSFQRGWMQHYLEPLIRPLGMPRRLELVAGVSVVVWNGLLYAVILWWLSER